MRESASSAHSHAPVPTSPTSNQSQRGGATQSLRGMGFAAGAEALAGRGGESPAAGQLKATMGGLLGVDLSDVKIHTSSAKPTGQEAHGLAEGRSVHLELAESELQKPEGVRLLAHELTHVVQAKNGGESSVEANESEADGAAEAIAAGKPATVRTGASPKAVRFKKKKHNGYLNGAQEASAIAYNEKRYSTAQMIQIQLAVGAAADGIVGPKTVEAIAAFQAKHGLAADGKVGPMTAGALGLGGGQAKPPQKPSNKPSGGGNKPKTNYLSPAQEQAAIAYNADRGFSYAQRIAIQEKVGAAADGDIGPKTVEKIAAWQAAHGLKADGKVGPATGAKMGISAGGGGGVGISPSASNAAKLSYAKKKAGDFGLVITSTTGGTHTPGSYHYKGRAIDVAGAPSKMAAYYLHMKKLKPTELFYDPLGGIKYGQEIGAIGGHSDHVHVAF